MLKSLFIFVFIAFGVVAFGQKRQHSLEFQFTPLIKSLIDPNKHDQNISNEHAKIDFKIPIYFEAGLQYQFNFDSTYGIGVGASWKYRQLSFSYELLRDPDDANSQIISSESRKVKLQYISIRPQIFYSPHKKIELGCFFSFYAPIIFNSNGNSDIEKVSFSSTAGYYVHERLIEGDGIYRMNFVPEVYFKYFVISDFSLFVGSKLKFWSKDSFFELEGEGYFNNSGGTSDLLFSEKFRNNEMSLYIGLAYRFRFKTK